MPAWPRRQANRSIRNASSPVAFHRATDTLESIEPPGHLAGPAVSAFTHGIGSKALTPIRSYSMAPVMSTGSISPESVF